MNNDISEHHAKQPNLRNRIAISQLPPMKFNSYKVLRDWLQKDLAESAVAQEEVRAATINVLGRLRPYAAIFDDKECAIYKQLEALI